MTAWRVLASDLNLVHVSHPAPAMNQGTMEGDRAGHRVRVRQIDEYRRTARTGITLTFGNPLATKLSVKASASLRGQAHWLWAALAGLLLCGGVGGAVAMLHPGPLVVCLGGALVLWGWLAARRSIARKKEKSILLGDPDLDRILTIEAENRDPAIERLETLRARELLAELARGDRELAITEREMTLDINRVLKTCADFEAVLDTMAELANLLVAKQPGHTDGAGSVWREPPCP